MHEHCSPGHNLDTEELSESIAAQQLWKIRQHYFQDMIEEWGRDPTFIEDFYNREKRKSELKAWSEKYLEPLKYQFNENTQECHIIEGRLLEETVTEREAGQDK